MKRTTLTITLEIEGGAADARQVVNEILDAGALQLMINNHDCDAGGLSVINALVTLTSEFETKE